MSTMLIVHCENNKLNSLYGFGKHHNNDNTFFTFFDKKVSRFDLLHVLNSGVAIYPEDFDNKRLYLQYIKDNKKILQEDVYKWRINQETIDILNREIAHNFLLFIGEIDDFLHKINDINSEKEFVQVDFSSVSERSTFNNDQIYLCVV